jgi:hypothetical protein
LQLEPEIAADLRQQVFDDTSTQCCSTLRPPSWIKGNT